MAAGRTYAALVVPIALALSTVLAGQRPEVAPPVVGGPPGAPIPGSVPPPGPGRGPAPPPPTPAQVERAGVVLAATRQALGGEKLHAVKSVTITGRTRRVRGNNLVPIEFEISLELPGKYLRRDESPFEESDPTSVGFNGDELIQLPAPTMPVMPMRPGPAGVPAPAGPRPSSRRRNAGRGSSRSSRTSFVWRSGFLPTRLRRTRSRLPMSPRPRPHRARRMSSRPVAPATSRCGCSSTARRGSHHGELDLPPTSVIMTVPGQPPAAVAPGAVVVTGPPAPAASASAAREGRLRERGDRPPPKSSGNSRGASPVLRRLPRRGWCPIAVPASARRGC